MAKFAVGDKVRMVSDVYGNKAMLVGHVGVIVDFDDEDPISNQDWLVRFDDADEPTNGYDDGWWCTATEIELVAPAKEGDN